jgi:hypothetical protein
VESMLENGYSIQNQADIDFLTQNIKNEALKKQIQDKTKNITEIESPLILRKAGDTIAIEPAIQNGKLPT